MTANHLIRIKARTNDVPLWQIGQKLRVSEATMTRWLRNELSTERTKLIYDAIDEIVAERGRDNG